jgi:hypothetical protein
MVDTETVAHALRSHPDAVTSVRDVADVLQEDVSDTHVRQRLRELEASGDVASKKVGARAVAWWHVDRVRPPVSSSSDDRGQSDPEDVDESRSSTTSRAQPEDGSKQGLSGKQSLSTPDLEDVVDRLELPSGKNPDECVDALSAAYERLQAEGSMTKADVVADVMPEHPIGYDVDAMREKLDAGDRYRGAWWRKIVKPGLDEIPDVEKPTGGHSQWRYTGGVR